MKKLILFFFVVLFSNSFSQQTTLTLGNQNFEKIDSVWYLTDSNSGMNFRVNTRSITIKLKEGFSVSTLDQVNNALRTRIVENNKLGYIDLELTENSNFAEIYNKLKNTGLFEIIEVNSYGEVWSNDPGYSAQYYLENTSGYPVINVNETWAWWYEDGSTNPQIVAVIDEGVDQTHPDLITDKTNDWDYVDNPQDDYPHPDNNLGQFDEDHGTAVAGIIAAKTDNSYGVAGVAGGYNTPGTKIMSLRTGEGVFSGTPGHPTPFWHSVILADKIDDAIIFAADNGAKIITMSFAVSQNSSIDAAIRYAYNVKGCLLVAASGHYSKDVVSYPASHDLVMSIGGIFKNWDHHGSFIGDLDVVAPSQDIYTLKNTFSGSPYGNWGSGTSASAPQVAGVAALLLSRDPSLLHMDLWNMINKTAIYNQLFTEPQSYYGNGLLQGNLTLEWLYDPSLAGYPSTPQNISITKIVGTNPIIHWSLVSGATSYKIYRSNSLGGRYGFTEVATVSSGTTSWTDYSVIVQHYKTALSTNYYRVAAVNSDNIRSILSAEVSSGVNITYKEIAFNEVDTYDYKLYKNYPNPFNPSTKIKFSLKEPGFVKLEVFNTIGEKVKELVNSILSEGIHEISFDAGSLSSGMYIYRINVTGKFVKSYKMILLK